MREAWSGVAGAGADDTWQVGDVDAIGVDQDEVPDSEAGEVLRDEGPGPADPDDADLLGREGGLAAVAEHAALPVERVVPRHSLRRGGAQPADARAEESGMIEDDPPVTGKPDVAGHGVAGEHERADRGTVEDVEQGWVAPLVRVHVVGGERDAVGSAVAVHGEVAQLVPLAVEDAVAHEGRGQHAVAAGAGHIVHPVACEVESATEQPHAPPGPRDRHAEHGGVLVPVTGEQVPQEVVGHPRGQVHAPRGGHRVRSHSSTLYSLISAVSVAGSSRLERREICTAVRFSKVVTLIPSPRSAPSARVRSPRTKCG